MQSNRTRLPVGLVERFWSKVDMHGPVPLHCPELGRCWLYLGSGNDGGYGLHRGTTAHRWLWALLFGPLARRDWLLHKCDRRRCVRPSHLFVGDARSNADDMDAKGRRVNVPSYGETNGYAKLTDADVRRIRSDHAAGVSQAHLARRHGVSPGAIFYVVHRLRWVHVV